jgi:hypothetical protein
MVARYFVFVEFSDPEVRNFLDQLRRCFSEISLNDSPHITVRGPYQNPPSTKLIEEYSDRLHGHGVLIADVGLFETRKGYAVFLHAKSKLFDEIWWKPDFSGPTSRRTPHVTIFESSSRYKANQVADFLRSEAIEIVTFNVELTVYVTKQQTLVNSKQPLLVANTAFPQNRLTYRSGLFDRANKVGDFLRSNNELPGSQRSLL